MRTTKLFKRAAYAVALWALCSIGVAAQTIDINATSITNGTGYTFANGVLTITQGGTYTITGNGTETNRRVVVNAVEATITISNVNISVVSKELSAFRLAVGANVTLNVEGTDSLKAASDEVNAPGLYGSGAAINVPEGASITIQGNGSLYAESGGHSAVIGGAHAPGTTTEAITTGEKCGDITITGDVTLTVNSVFRGPAIGSGANGAELGGDIRILPGDTPGFPKVDLTIYQDAPVIGAMTPLNPNGKVIEIQGGTVTGHAGGDIAYIGGPESRWYDKTSSDGGVNFDLQNPSGLELGNITVKISGGMVTLGTIVAKNKEITGGTVLLSSGLKEIGFSFNVAGKYLGRMTNVGRGNLTVSGGSFSCDVTGEYGAKFDTEPQNSDGVPVFLNALTLTENPANLAVDSVIVGGVPYNVHDVKTDSAGKVYLWLPTTYEFDEVGDSLIQRKEEVILKAGGKVYSRTYARPFDPVALFLLAPGHPIYTVTFSNEGGDPIASQDVAKGEAIDNSLLDPKKEDLQFQGWYAAALQRWWNLADPVEENITLTARWFPENTINLTTVSGNGTGYTFAEGVLTITESGDYIITSLDALTGCRVVVAAGVTANVTVSGLNVSVVDNSLSAFTLAAGASVTLNVEGENSIVAASADVAAPWGSGAAINVPKGASITIKGDGALYAESGGHSAVIGGAHIEGNDDAAFTTGEECGDITITGDVTLTVSSKLRGPAIGSGVRNAELGGDIKILAGTKPGYPVLDLTVEQLAPVIGAYTPQSVNNQKVIEITGGTVTARATDDIAYIGNASTAWYQVSPDSARLIGYSAVKISGGKVTVGSIVANTKEITGGTVALTSGVATLNFADYYTNVGLGTLAISGGSVNIAALDENLQPTNSANDVYLNTLTLSAKNGDDATHPANATVTAATVGSAAYTGIKDVVTDGSGKVYLWLPASSGEVEVSLTAGDVDYKRAYARPEAPIARFLVAGDYPFDTVTFMNGGNVHLKSPVANGEAVDEPTKPTTPPTGMEDKEFFGWYTAQATADSTRWNFANPVTQDTTLYAGWEYMYKVVFVVSAESQGVVSRDTVKVFNGYKVASPAEAAGYEFSGWYADAASFTPGNRWSFETSVVTTDTTLYATRTAIVYNINYLELGNGANNEDNPATYTVESNTITLLPATREHYNFLQWEDYAYNKVTVIPAGSTGDLNLYPAWAAIEYSITYNLDGGANAAGNPDTYTVEDTITLAAPTRAGYTFAGWYNAETEGSKVTAIATGTTGNLVLWARWTKNETETGVESVTAATLPVYPNPTTGIVNVASDGEEVLLYSATGALLKRTREAQLDLSGYPSGIYVLKAGKKTTKVVKQ